MLVGVRLAVTVARLRLAAVEVVVEAEQRGLEHRCRRQVRVGTAARHAILDPGGGAAFARHAVGARSIVEAPVRPVAGDEARHEPLVAVDQRRADSADNGFVVREQSAEAPPGDGGNAVLVIGCVEAVADRRRACTVRS